jgi:hypothetical protein
MAEAAMQKKVGAKKKDAGTEAVAPVLLSDGKTPASESALTRALGIYGLPVPATLKEKLEAVRAHLKGVFAVDPHVCDATCENPETSKCTKVECECKEIATYDTPFCPFCGDLGLPQGAPPVASAPPAPPPPPPPAVEEPVIEDASATEEPTMTTTVSDDAPEEPEEEPAPAAESAPVEEPPVAEELMLEAPAPEQDGDDSDAAALTPASTVEVLPDAPQDKTAALDASVARIESLKQQWGGVTFDLALELKKVQDEQLFLARGYDNFGAWAVAEVKISRSLAYELAKVAGEFDRETYLTVGSSKLRLIAGIEDPEKREAALQEAKAGAPARTLERNHTTRAAARAAPAPEGGKGKAAPVPEPVKPKETPKKGTEIVLLAKVNGRAVTHPFYSSKTNREIKKYTEDAYVEVRLADNVVQHIAPKFGPDGELLGLTVKFIETVEAT